MAKKINKLIDQAIAAAQADQSPLPPRHKAGVLAHWVLDHQQTEKFDQVLSDPPEPNQELKDLMKRKAPWED